MKRKIALIITAVTAAVMLTACAEIPEPRQPDGNINVIAAPADGWTKEELLNVTYIDGIGISEPFTLRQMGGGYGYASLYGGSSGVRAVLENTRDILAVVDFGEDITESAVTADTAVSEIKLTYDFSVNGLSRTDGEGQIKAALGEPDRIEEKENGSRQYIYLDKVSGRELMRVTVSGSGSLWISLIF